MIKKGSHVIPIEPIQSSFRNDYTNILENKSTCVVTKVINNQVYIHHNTLHTTIWIPKDVVNIVNLYREVNRNV